MNWCLASSHSAEHLAVRELSLHNHVAYATRHNMDVHWLVKPWPVARERGVPTMLELVKQYDAVLAVGADVIFTNLDLPPDTFFDAEYGAVFGIEDIGGCHLNNDTAVYNNGKGTEALNLLLAQKDRAMNHLWIWQGVMAEMMNEQPEFAKLVKLLPPGTIQSLPPWEYPEHAGCWKPGHFCCHFLMENKVDRMKRFLSEHPEYT